MKKNRRGGNGDNENLDDDSQNEDDNEESPDEVPDGNIDDDDDVEPQRTDHNFNIYTKFTDDGQNFISNTPHIYRSDIGYQPFIATWYDDKGVENWANAPDVNFGGSTNTGTDSIRAGAMSYSYSNLFNVPRYVRISDGSHSGYTRVGVTKSSSWSNTSYTTSNTSTYYYNGSSLSTSKVSCANSVTGTVYVLLRKNYTVKFYSDNRNGNATLLKTVTMLAGVGVTAPRSNEVSLGGGKVLVNWSSTNGGGTLGPGGKMSNSLATKDLSFYANVLELEIHYGALSTQIRVTNSTNINIRTSRGTLSSSSISPGSGSEWLVANGQATHTLTFTRANTSYDYYIDTGSTATSHLNSTTYSWNSGGTIRHVYIYVSQRYTITYNANGGSNAPGSQYKAHGTSVTLSSTKPTRSGYEFLGWSTSSNATSATYDPGDTFSNEGNTTLYAVWEKQVTLSYNANGGSGSMSSQTCAVGEKLTVKSNSFSHSGYYYFNYWSTSSSGGTRYDPGDTITMNSDVTLYARWYYDPPYTWETITYKANYPNGTTATYTQDVRSDSSVGILSASECGFSTPTGYTWSHWNTNSSGTGTNWYDYETWYGSRGSDILYAVWSRNSYTNRYYYRNTSGNQDYDDQTRYYNSSYTLFTTSNISEYVSNGWSLYKWTTSSSSTSISGSGVYNPGTSLSSTSTSILKYYAISRRTVYLSYNSNGGSSVSSTSGTQYWNQYGNYKTSPTLTVTSTIPTRTGYNFLGWSTSSSATSASYHGGNSYTFSKAYNTSSTATLYAVWEPKIIKVTLDKNEGSGGTSTIYLKYNSGWYSNSSCTSSITSITKPIRTGWTFNGYYTSTSGGAMLINSSGSITASDTYYSTDGTKTIYAQWKANNPAYYDEEGGYWYVENGYMPQKKVTDNGTISGINSSSITGNTYHFAGLTLQSKAYGGQEYCQYNGNWYEVMPIRWRLVYSSSQTTGYGTTTDTLAVMAEIVYVDAFSDSYIGAGAGYSSESVAELMKNQIDSSCLVSESKSMPTFGSTSLNGTAKSVSGNMFVASYDDLSNFTTNKNGTEKLGKIKFSDLAKDYLRANGKDTLYYTRDLGKTYNHIYCMNANGDRVQYKAQNYFGVQFAVKISEYACI